METARLLRTAALGGIIAACGCGGPSAPVPAANATASAPAKAAATGEAAEVAKRFLQAILRGDAATARRWLSPAAAERAAADPSILAPLGLRVAELEVAEVRRVSDTEAIAQCLLAESQDSPVDELCCLMRRCDEGWRVIGLACEAGPGGEPAVVQFEQPAGPPVGSGPSDGFVGPGAGAVDPAARTAAKPEPPVR